MALPEDLDALCIQQLFRARAAESSHLEELDDFDLVLSQTSDAELSALCTQGSADLYRSTFQSSNPIGQNIIHNYMRRCPNNTLN